MTTYGNDGPCTLTEADDDDSDRVLHLTPTEKAQLDEALDGPTRPIPALSAAREGSEVRGDVRVASGAGEAALDAGIDLDIWDEWQDRAMALVVERGELLPVCEMPRPTEAEASR